MPSRNLSESMTFIVLEMARLMRIAFEERVSAAGLGVTASEARLLAHLSHAGPLRQSELAERLGLAQMSVSGFVDRLEGSGLLVRKPDPHDRRAKQVALTDAAAPVLERVGEIGAEIRRLARGDMTENEWRDLTMLAGRARDNLAGARYGASRSARR